MFKGNQAQLRHGSEAVADPPSRLSPVPSFIQMRQSSSKQSQNPLPLLGQRTPRPPVSHQAVSSPYGANRCPHCGGNLMSEWDRLGDVVKCLQCGRVVDILSDESLVLTCYNRTVR